MDDRIKNNDLENSDNYTLDLSPMLALMVTLIPILLLSSVFVHVVIIETELPQVVKEAIVKNNQSKKDKVSVQLKMVNDKSFIVFTIKGKKSDKQVISAKDEEWNFEELHQLALNIKKQYPEHFSMEIYSDPEVTYEDIVKAMDEIRASKQKEKEFEVNDPKTNKKYKTRLMFPDVVFADILEG